MAHGDFYKRVIIPVRQRPISEDLNRLQNQHYETVRALGNHTFNTPVQATVLGNPQLRFQANPAFGFSGAGFWVAPNPAATPFGLTIYPGAGYSPYNPANVTDYDSANGVNYTTNNNWSPLVLSDFETGFTVPTPPTAGNARIDRIEVTASYLANNPQTVGVFNTSTRVFDPATRNKDFTWDLRGRTGSVIAPASSTAPLSYKRGVVAVGGLSAATPAPATAGYITIALVNVLGGAASITQADIVDMRRPLLPGGVLRVAGKAGIPGVAAGMGSTEGMVYTETPPGVFIKMAYQNNVAPSAGTSYTARFYVIGGNLFPLAGTNTGSLVASVTGSAVRTVVVSSQTTSLSSSDLDILDGTDTTWTVTDGLVSFALSQPCCILEVTIKHPAGSALSNVEEFCFQYSLGLG